MSTQNTSDPLARHCQQQPTMEENKPDSSGGRNQEEADMKWMGHTHIEESTKVCHKASPHLKSSRPKEERETKEHITQRNGDRHEKNERQLDRTVKEG
ncbi:unnamed protein product [Schistosoma margrebowiei]|uniref:Uncharacterized protein n=1 Tax=Schistosoma margrebowiei TaxID=48269 RepID=A0A183MVA3_9TREM|nr:unnamed protein product [Schistosoma margrebowiei]